MLLHQDVEPLLFLNMFEERSTEAIATDLFPSIKFETALQLGIQAPEVKQGESAEMHKEPGDKDAIRKLLLTLSGDELGRRLVYGEEVMFVPPTSDRGPRGKRDLVIGTTVAQSSLSIIIKKLLPTCLIQNLVKLSKMGNLRQQLKLGLTKRVYLQMLNQF